VATIAMGEDHVERSPPEPTVSQNRRRRQLMQRRRSRGRNQAEQATCESQSSVVLKPGSMKKRLAGCSPARRSS